MKERIGLDLDGVLYNWMGAVHTYYKCFRGNTENIVEFSRGFDRRSKQETDFAISMIDLYYKMVPSTKEVDLVRSLADKYEIFYVTARPEEARRTTLKYLTTYKYPYQKNLILTKDKATIARAFNLSVFLDDNVSHIDSMKNILTAILMVRPYNMDVAGNYNHVYSLKEFCRLVL